MRCDTKKSLPLLLASILVLTACEKADIAKNTPPCVKSSTIKFAKSSICEDGGNVKEYLFQNKLVYVFDQGSCGNDVSFSVIDAECNALGSLGGFGGNTTINGESFRTAEYQRTVWED